MALIKCPECGHDVSDTAASCPNCGYIPETDYWLFKVYLLLASGGVAASWCAAFLRSREIESYAIWIYIGAIALIMRHWFLLAAAIAVCAVAYFANED